MRFPVHALPLVFLAIGSPLCYVAQTTLPDTLVHMDGKRTPVQLSRLEGQRIFYRDKSGWRSSVLDSITMVIGKGNVASMGNSLIAERKGRLLLRATPERQSLDHYARNHFSDYQPLQCTGIVPLDLREYYLEASEQSVQGRQKKKGRFVKDNTVAMGYLFATGRVLFNDPLSNYSATVLDTLLRNDVALRGRLRVFCIRSTEVNAYTTNDGKIFVTLGLLARLKSRAELAFVLAHEVQHYLHRDVYESFVLNRRLTKRMRTLGTNQESAEHLLRSRYRRSRQQEISADSAAVLLYHASPFGALDPGAVFDVLAHSERAIYEEAPGGDFFCTVPSTIQGIFAVAPEDLTQAEHDHDTTFATHPAIDERRIMLQSMSTGHAWTAMAHDDPYALVRTMAGFELAYTYYIDGEHEQALIQMNGLLAEHPDNRFLMELSVKSLRALAETAHRNSDKGSVEQGDTVTDPVTAAFRSAIGRMTRHELLASVIHRYALIPDAGADLDLHHCAATAAKALKESGHMPAIPGPPASTTKERPAPMVQDTVEVPTAIDSLAAQRSNDTLVGSAQDTSIVAMALDSLSMTSVKDPSEALGSKASNTKDAKAKVPRIADMLAALMADTVAARSFDLQVIALHSDRMGRSTGNGHVVIPYILILDTLGQKHALEPQRAFARYCRDIERIRGADNLKVTAMSSFGLDSADTQNYNDFCFYQDQLQAYLTSGGYPLVLDRDRMTMMGERHDARYLTLSFVLMTKNRFIFKLGRWLVWGFLIPGGAGAVFGLHCFSYKYTGKQFTVVYDLWTGQEISNGYASRRSYMSARPSSRKFKRSLEQR